MGPGAVGILTHFPKAPADDFPPAANVHGGKGGEGRRAESAGFEGEAPISNPESYSVTTALG